MTRVAVTGAAGRIGRVVSAGVTGLGYADGILPSPKPPTTSLRRSRQVDGSAGFRSRDVS